MDRSTLGDSKQGGRCVRSPCRIIRQAVTDWPEESSPGILPLPVTPYRSRPSCDDGGDDAWWPPATRPRPVLPCSCPPPVLPCWPQPLVLPCSVPPQGPEQMPASPTRWRRKLPKELKGCASYSWISLIWAVP